MSFTTTVVVRFAHVDAAGIVFYPRYLEMLNGAIEEYFADLGVDFRTMHLDRRLGVPTVRLEADFVHPSRLGDRLAFTLVPVRVGRSSVDMVVRVDCAAERRFTAKVILVCIDLISGRSTAWPDDMRPIAASVD
jgi:4-hydroxybenzoyl-CoA thioesterase